MSFCGVSFSIIIPCHNDCKKAESLSKTTIVKHAEKVFVGHNGCKNKVCLDWSNKAKTINYYAKQITSNYTIVLDADITPSPFSIMAFIKPMQEKRVFGCSRQIYQSKQNSISSSRSVFNGASWFCKTKVLQKIKVPEDCVTEDTLFVEKLKDKKITPLVIEDSVIFVEMYEKNYSKMFRQRIRYDLGALQMMKHKKFNYATPVILQATLVTFLFATIIYSMTQNIFFALLLFLFIDLIALIFKKHSDKEQKLRIADTLFTLTAPLIAMAYFLLRKKTW